MNPPPIDPPGQPRKSGLAIASLACGIASVLCLGMIAGIPAVICGHIAHSKISKAAGLLTGGGMALAGLVMGYLSIFLTVVVLPILAAIALPAILTAKDQAMAVRQLSDAKAIHLAMMQAALDRKTTGDVEVGFPADIGARSAKQLGDMLVAKGYLSADDLRQVHFEQFEVGNVSEEDPADTIVLRTKPANPRSRFIVMRKAGDGNVLRSQQAGASGKAPPRDPPFLQ